MDATNTDQQTPPTANVSTAAPSAPVKAPKAKRSLQKHEAWAEFVGGMDTMPADQASKLAPKDIGVQFGPIMDEAQFEAYRKARKGRVHVMK